MKLPTSNKTAVFGRKPYVKRGYYPAQLLSVKPYADKDGKLIKGKYGFQLIFEFAIFEKDENDAPVKPFIFKEEGKNDVPVIIPKFVYHEYFDKGSTDEVHTAITPNSAITKVLESLGWIFSEEDVDPEKFIGNWVEVNLSDYETETKDKVKYICSSIKDIGKYKGPKISDLETVEKKEPAKVKKELKHEEVKKDSSKEIQEIDVKIEELKKLNKNGYLTDEGLKQAIEQLKDSKERLK